MSRSFSERKKILQYQYQLKAEEGVGEMRGSDRGDSGTSHMAQSGGDVVRDGDTAGEEVEEEDRATAEIETSASEGWRGADGPGEVSISSSSAAATAAAATAASMIAEGASGAGRDKRSATSGGSGISRSRFLNAIEVSAEGIAVLRKLHEQVCKYNTYHVPCNKDDAWQYRAVQYSALQYRAV